jgi:chlorite dismutase
MIASAAHLSGTGETAMQGQFAFIGGRTGSWRVVSVRAVCGQGLEAVARVDVRPSDWSAREVSDAWTIEGQISNLRYATKAEVAALKAKQESLGRPSASHAAMIPIKKSTLWWDLAQDERRAIFEETSHHTKIGMQYLPGIARQLYHSRDLGQPFDFITWFEYAPDQAASFERLVARLRSTPEWNFVEREVDIRLERQV